VAGGSIQSAIEVEKGEGVEELNWLNTLLFDSILRKQTGGRWKDSRQKGEKHKNE
jgi:hypothetical protein